MNVFKDYSMSLTTEQ